MIDIGINLSHGKFKNVNGVINRAKSNGLNHLICTGTTIDSSKRSIELCNNYKGYLSSTVGVHPHYVKDISFKDYGLLKNLALSECVVAIGECGLDYDRNFSDVHKQRDMFRMQLDLAREVNKPLFLHERSAFDDFVNIMSDYNDLIEHSVVHCFTGDKENLKSYVELGFMIGITGWISDNKRGNDLREAVKYLPLDRLMIETDGPFLRPHNVPEFKKCFPNEPSNLIYVVEKLSDITGISVESLIDVTTENTKRFFNLNIK